MKKLLIAALAFTVAVTSCKDRDETPAPTNFSKNPTLPVDTIDIRDIAAGNFADSTTADFIATVSFTTDTNSIDRMFIHERGQLVDIISIESEDFGFVFFGSGFTEAKLDGYYTLETDIWTVRVIEQDTVIWNFKRVD